MAYARIIMVCLIHFLLDICQAEVIITDYDGTTPIETFQSIAASFGKPLPEKGLEGFAVVASPENGCSPMSHAPHSTSPT